MIMMVLELKYSQCSHRLWVQTCLNQLYKPVWKLTASSVCIDLIYNSKSIYNLFKKFVWVISDMEAIRFWLNTILILNTKELKGLFL